VYVSQCNVYYKNGGGQVELFIGRAACNRTSDIRKTQTKSNERIDGELRQCDTLS